MAEIILLHGIAQEQRSADSLQSTWLVALASGIRTAGSEELADRIWRDGRPGNARMAFYGDPFRRAGQQPGTADALTLEQQALYDALLAKVLANAADRGIDERDRLEAEHVLAANQLDRQCVRDMAHSLLNVLLRVGPFARLCLSAGERLLGALRQVSLYLTDDEIRAAAQQCILDLVDSDTQVIIAHLLSTVVAYEALHRVDQPLPLLVTLESPLGMRTVIYERLRPQHAQVLASVWSWVNVADRDDLGAAALDLTASFPGADGVLESHWTVDNGGKPYEATHYLTKAEIGRSVAVALAS
ncbi:hypothetical protein [Lentzea sp. E54]|uniref:hypothetical protein n=1 Tax=Lentzea xerophila TaxID=3435883 RepID=UPI003DA64D0B